MLKRLLTLSAATLLFVMAPAQAQLGDDTPRPDLRVKELLDQTDYNWEVDQDGDFKLILQFDDERSQIVFVSSRTFVMEGLEIREVWSVGDVSENNLSPLFAMRMLEENAQVKLGAWELQDWDGTKVSIFRAKISANANLNTLNTAISAVGITADEREKEFVGTDEL